MSDERNIRIKAPQDVLLDLPQERITGDILRGYGPRRGNLERLLRYWRPIMRKPGGFRRCRIILANHPELYPLERICAWLHHETTGRWPNEGCHHPGMKNCKNKLRKRNWSNAQFARHLRGAGGKRTPGNLRSRLGISRALGKSMGDDCFLTDFHQWGNDEPIMTRMGVPVNDDMAYDELISFVNSEQDFADYLRNYSNWETETERPDGTILVIPFSSKSDNDCCGGLDEK
jgi:hypothetical protein